MSPASRLRQDDLDAMGLVLGAQAGLDPADLVARDNPCVLAQAARAASVLIAARMRRLAPCRTGATTWQVDADVLTFATTEPGRLVPALVCTADGVPGELDWTTWDALWDQADPCHREITRDLLTLLTTETTPC